MTRRRQSFDRDFDAFTAGILDGLTGGKIREAARRTVGTVQQIRPYAGEALRRVAAAIDPDGERDQGGAYAHPSRRRP
jgi:hypothetical protein